VKLKKGPAFHWDDDCESQREQNHWIYKNPTGLCLFMGVTGFNGIQFAYRVNL